jgi:outer membrane lipoprotein-sorting protein
MKDNKASLQRWGLFVAAILLVCATLVGAAATQDEPTGKEVLEDVEATYEGAENVVGSAEVTVENETERWTADVDFAVAEENKSRLTVRYEERTVVLGTNGSVGWTYEPTTGITRTYDNETEKRQLERKALEAKDRYDDEVNSEYIGTETIDGERAYVVEAYSSNETVSETARLWVDREDSEVLKTEVTGENGTVTAVFEDTNFDVNVHRSTFEPPSEGGDLVPGAERDTFDTVEEALSETELTVPDLSDEYETQEVLVASYRGEDTVTSTYETDSGDVYVAVTTQQRFGTDGETGDGEGPETGERIDLGDGTATYIDSQRGSMVYWTEGDRTVAVFTRGPRSTAVEVAESVR